MHSRRNWLIAVVAIGAPLTVHAQQTGPVDPGRMDERLRPAPEIPDAAPVAVPELPRQDNRVDTSVSVRLSEIRFEGASVVTLADLNRMALPYLNRDMPLSEAFVLADAITNEYRRRGHVLSRAVVGPQRIENGILVIQIIEGFIGKTSINGDAGGYAPYLEGYLKAVRAGRPASGDALTRALLLARDLGGIETQAVLTPSLTENGAADLTLAVKRKAIDGYFALDNRGTRWLGPVQLYAGLTFNDLLGAGERLSISGVTAPVKRELGFASVTYDQPLGTAGLRATLFSSFAYTRPGDELRLLDMKGRSLTFGGALRYPFVRSRDANLYGRLAFTGRDSSSSNFALDPIFRDKTRTFQVEIFGNYAAPWGGLFSTRATLTQGLNVFGATIATDKQKSRATATGAFTKLNFEASLTQGLGSGLYFQLSGIGQYSSSSLLASEEFGIGGEQFGRAYDPSEITGDQGIAGRTELFYAASYARGSVQPYAYFEIGRVQQNKLLPGEAASASLKSAGGGLRVGLRDGVSGSFEFAAPLSRPVASRGNKNGRLFFSLTAAF